MGLHRLALTSVKVAQAVDGPLRHPPCL